MLCQLSKAVNVRATRLSLGLRIMLYGSDTLSTIQQIIFLCAIKSNTKLHYSGIQVTTNCFKFRDVQFFYESQRICLLISSIVGECINIVQPYYQFSYAMYEYSSVVFGVRSMYALSIKLSMHFLIIEMDGAKRALDWLST